MNSLTYNNIWAGMSENVLSDICAQRRFRSACAFAQSDQNLHWAIWVAKDARVFITKTCLYNFDPLIPHFYIVKLGFRGVYIIFHISAQNIDCGYSLEPARRGGSNEYPQSMFWAEIWKISGFFYLKIFSFWRWNFLYIWIGMFS